MNIDEMLDHCVDMLLFINRNELEGEPEVGIKLERNEGEWELEFADYNDEPLHTLKGNNLEKLVAQAVEEIRAKLTNEATEAMKILEKGQKLLEGRTT